MSEPRIYTNATISADPSTDYLVNIQSHSSSGATSALTILTQQEITDELKSWLRTLPLEQRQLILDELTACTLRTLE